MIVAVVVARTAMDVSDLVRVTFVEPVVPRGFAGTYLALESTADRAQHGARDRPPNREQHGQQQQEAESNGFHGKQASGDPGRPARLEIVNLVTVTRSNA